MLIVRDKITIAELNGMAKKMFGHLVKAVVDVENEIMVVDADMHVDEEILLLEEEISQQENLWGVNLFPDKFRNSEWIIFDSMINLRPSYGNVTRGVDDPKMQEKIKIIVNKLVVQ